MINTIRLIIIFVFALSCDTGKLEVIADVSSELIEVSAAEITPFSNYLWTIEDSGNKNHLYGLGLNGQIMKEITIKNATNIDWEDLTSDEFGNIYIGDFGNNNKERTLLTIYKILKTDLDASEANAQRIDFRMPSGQKPKDFEAFFLWKDHFYIFSKEAKKFIVLKVPNRIGEHVAVVTDNFNLEGNNNKITSADINDDGKQIVLLTDDKLWHLYPKDSLSFFSGEIERKSFEYRSQNEGICFKNDSIVYITDERNGTKGGNIYKFKLN